MISKREKNAMEPSSRFILSAEYFPMPIDKILRSISEMNIQVNHLLKVSRVSTSYYDIPYEFKESVIVFKRTKRFMVLSKVLDLTNTLDIALSLFIIPFSPFGHTLILLRDSTIYMDFF